MRVNNDGGELFLMSSAGLDNFSQYLNVRTPTLGVKMKLAWTDFEPPLLDPDRMVKILKLE